MNLEENLCVSSPSWYSLCKAWIKRLDWRVFALLCLPFVLIVLNDGWLFSYALRGYIDPWVYFGYFLDLKQHLNTFPGTYYGTRLPWILPGFLAYQLFPPLIAAYVLHLTFYNAAVISLYQILRHTISRRVAFFTAVLMGCHYFFLESIGIDYVDGAGLTYLLLTLWMLTPRASEERPYMRLVCAGIFYGCVIYTQLFLITFTPLLILYFLFMNRLYGEGIAKLHLDSISRFFRWIRILPQVAYSQSNISTCGKTEPAKKPSKSSSKVSFAILSGYKFFFLGFVGVTLFFCTVNYCLNGTFLFFVPIVKWTVNFTSQANPWWHELSVWWKKAIWLVCPFVVFCGSIAFLLFRRSVVGNRRFFQLYFALNIGMYLILELWAHQPVLNLSYYTSYMMPALFLALGAQLADKIENLSKKQFYTILSSGTVLFFLVYRFPIHHKADSYLILVPLVVGLVALFEKMTLRKELQNSLWRSILMVFSPVRFYRKLTYSIENRRLAAKSESSEKSAKLSPNGVLQFPLSLVVIFLLLINGLAIRAWQLDKYTSDFQKDAFVSIVKSVRAIQSMDPKGSGRFWYDCHLPLGSVWRSVSSTYLWGYRLFNEDFPELKSPYLSYEVTPSDRLFIISEDGDVLKKANQKLAAIGLEAIFLDERVIEQRSVNYYITYVKLKKIFSKET